MNGIQENQKLESAQNASQPIGIKKKGKLTQKRLKEVLHYWEDIGVLTWIKRLSPTGNVGDIAGWVHSSGYVYICIDSQIYPAHRLVWFYHLGLWPMKEIDHINGIRYDNRLVNLRDVSHSDNLKNHSGEYKTNKSGVSGVNWCKNNGEWKWKVYIGSHNKQIHLGYYLDKQEVINARKKAEKEYGFLLNKNQFNQPLQTHAPQR